MDQDDESLCQIDENKFFDGASDSEDESFLSVISLTSASEKIMSFADMSPIRKSTADSRYIAELSTKVMIPMLAETSENKLKLLSIAYSCVVLQCDL